MKKFLILFSLLFILNYKLNASPLIIPGQDEQSRPININFQNQANELKTVVHKTSTETIKGVKHFYIITSTDITAINLYPTQIKGTLTNDNAPAGFIGEYKSSAATVGTNFPTTAEWGDLVSISLTAGDWDVIAILGATANGATVTDTAIGINASAGNIVPGNLGDGYTYIKMPSATTNGGGIISMRQSLASTTTIYLKYYAVYTVAIP